MEQALFDILAALETKERLDERELTKIINRHNKRILDNKKAAGQGTRAAERETASFRAEEYRDAATAKSTHAAVASPRSAGDDKASGKKQGSSAKARPLSKRQLMAFYLDVQKNQPERWARWNLSSEQQRRLVRTLQMKPRRTASGVATITVLTKPWKCSSNCLYCPNDLRMPKSYLADEPACQRAERTFFDPYLQVAARLKALTEMGHVTDKVELIVLGGTWSDYPESYQRWFTGELFRALNLSDEERLPAGLPDLVHSRALPRTERWSAGLGKRSRPEERLRKRRHRKQPRRAEALRCRRAAPRRRAQSHLQPGLRPPVRNERRLEQRCPMAAGNMGRARGGARHQRRCAASRGGLGDRNTPRAHNPRPPCSAAPYGMHQGADGHPKP